MNTIMTSQAEDGKDKDYYSIRKVWLPSLDMFYRATKLAYNLACLRINLGAPSTGVNMHLCRWHILDQEGCYYRMPCMR